DVTAYQVPANEIAAEIGNTKTANMVMLGAIIGAAEVVSTDAVLKAFAKMFAKKPELVAINEIAIRRGIKYIKDGN
ncbi:MAG: 2-oxoacid:acceptor oxidoreductase, gamma subunit, pyruvate/2-ketoisovalerate family, partial [Pelosinus sp.]|nr:2-oxoacid:acceptor oxidoreductase, gamma subunit, pyruvate/2-ketoisovalerate family [Pelosinus sp.]